jgi:hypothetical protein
MAEHPDKTDKNGWINGWNRNRKLFGVTTMKIKS